VSSSQEAGQPRSLFFRQALLASGWARDVRITIASGRIASIESNTPLRPGESSELIAVPASINLHSHAFQHGMAGLAERRGPVSDSFWTWRQVMYRFLDMMTPEDVEATTSYAFMEMLESGFCRVGEFHYVHNDPQGRPYASVAEVAERIVASADRTGIALTLLPVFYAHSAFGGAEPLPGQRRFINGVDGFAKLLEASRKAASRLARANVGVAPHSLRAVEPTELAEVLTFAKSEPVHIHVAEQVKEVEDCLTWCGQRPVEWLLDHAPVSENWCLIHATHMTEAETSRLAATGAVAGLCPVTEANLGDGTFNGAEWLTAGGRYGIGTDSNVCIGLAAELRQLEYSQRLRRRLRNVMAPGEGASTGASLFLAALDGGAQALGVEASHLAVGVQADIVGLNANHPSIVHCVADAILDGWIFAANWDLVDSVWCDGLPVVTGGRHVRRDTIEAAYVRSLGRLLNS
jgi:formimidoylglutamate deiminase